MQRETIRTGRLDRVAMALSGLCLVHCLATALLIGLLSSAAGFLGDPIIHEVGLVIAMTLGAIALGRGFRQHGYLLPVAVGSIGLGLMAFGVAQPEGSAEALFTITGVLLLALGHQLNRLAHD